MRKNRNRLLTKKEAAKDFLLMLEKHADGDKKILRALVYSLQTSLGGFPSSRKDQNDYIYKKGKYA